MKQLLSTILVGSAFAAEIDCPNETAYHVDLDSTSLTFGETVATGQCGCLGFNSEVVGTDSTLVLQVMVLDNEPLRGFQFTLMEESQKALEFEWARAIGKSDGWQVWDIRHPDGSVTLFGFDIDGGETQAGTEGVFLEVMFTVAKMLPSYVSFYLGKEKEVILSDNDGENIICSYPDRDNPLTVEVNWLENQIGIELIPPRFALHPGFPNPFNPSTTIQFDLPMDSNVRISVYDIAGREIAVLTEERFRSGKYSIEWRGITDSGQWAPSGIYYIKLTTGEFSQTHKLTLLK
ncbi:MAG: T9SS type A sorting domain-containing protein [Candidatus Neomarinimicrobiota bacterium]|nr:T9SS type A sorting domain-containing protein [Candidatus Neomarinimicrobiota bacterium]